MSGNNSNPELLHVGKIHISSEVPQLIFQTVWEQTIKDFGELKDPEGRLFSVGIEPDRSLSFADARYEGDYPQVGDFVKKLNENLACLKANME